MKHLKKIIIFFSVIIIFLPLVFLYNEFKETDFNGAKKETVRFLKRNENELQRKADELLKLKTNNIMKYKNKSYYYNINAFGNEYIKFDINSQGMLGGQYWGIIYSYDDLLEGERIHIYNEKDGNNIYIIEKIKENWYFYYDDYDAKIDINDIK